MKAIGRKIWAVPGGHISPESMGPEPECTSRDVLCLLNAGGTEAHLEATVYYADRDPVGPYRLTVPSRRVRHVRVNDLVDPLPVPLDVDYGMVVTSDVPIIVQFTRFDTSRGAATLASTIGFPADR
jgi:hypothetical protein